jgi:hypothetical protein
MFSPTRSHPSAGVGGSKGALEPPLHRDAGAGGWGEAKGTPDTNNTLLLCRSGTPAVHWPTEACEPAACDSRARPITATALDGPAGGRVGGDAPVEGGGRCTADNATRSALQEGHYRAGPAHTTPGVGRLQP